MAVRYLEAMDMTQKSDQNLVMGEVGVLCDIFCPSEVRSKFLKILMAFKKFFKKKEKDYFSSMLWPSESRQCSAPHHMHIIAQADRAASVLSKNWPIFMDSASECFQL